MEVDGTLDTLRLVEDAHGPVCLLVMAGHVPGRVVELEGDGPWTIGRSRKADILVEDASVSRLHARVHLQPRPTVEDLGSANGTRVRGVDLEPDAPTSIQAGEPFSVGSIVVVLSRRAHLPGAGVAAPAALDAVIGDAVVASPAMRQVFAIAAKVAPSDLSVLVMGETGAGKEIVARAIHRGSGREGPFLAINCGAVPENLLESELFGHEKGAFTGADDARVGRFEAANGGTIFLDEIGELPAASQAKLLRVLERREVMPVGADEPRAIDVRFVSATHRDLAAEALRADGFRADLYFRISGATLYVPPLRDRPEDLDALATHFAEGTRIDRGARAALRAHRWPGNVRELANVIARARVLGDGRAITAAHLALGDAPRRDVDDASLQDEMKALERERIVEALEASEGNQTRAAKLLGMPRRTFVSRLDEYGIPRPRKNKRKKKG